MVSFPSDAFLKYFAPHESCLPEVARRLAEWLCLAPGEIAPRIWEAIATMAKRMAGWVGKSWSLQMHSRR